MLEDYVVSVRLPVEPTASPVLGTGFGLSNDETSGTVWYSDGQDIWLPAAASTLYAMFRGLIRFVPSGRADLEPPPDTPPSPDPEAEPSPLLPAIGDCLVLELWPQDYLRLVDLLPDAALVPKRIVYQNVDRASAMRRAAELIEHHVDHYEKLFLEEGESELEPAVVVTRAREWLERDWIEGRGVGVYADPTDGPVPIGDAAAPPATAPSGLPAYARLDHGTPSGASGFRRLTLKVLDAEGRLFHPSFLFYLLTRIENDALAKSWTASQALIAAELGVNSELPAVRVASRLEDDDAPLDPDPPPPLPLLRLRIKHAAVPVWIGGLHDPFDNPDQGRWRFQSLLPPGDYQDTHDAPPVIERRETPRITPVGALTDPFFTEVRFPHWFPFFDPDAGERRRRFILGVNMESCRRRHYHDLSATDLLYDYYTAGAVDPRGQLQTTYGPSGVGAPREPWLSNSANVDRLRDDLDAIRAMGVSAIRVWAFEYLEGIRFAFAVPTDPATGRGSPLMLAREAADAGTHPQLRSYVFPGPITVHGCSRLDFENHIAADWRARSLFAVAPPSNPLFQQLLTNAAMLQAMAGARGLRVLWTLMTHLGETKPQVPGHQLIHALQARTTSLPTRLSSAADWAAYYADTPLAGDGRLPIEAWIYRALITDAALRRSYIDNALIPFVNHMENIASGEPLGYEVCNEIDILWNRCSHSWAMRLSGDPVNMRDVDTIYDHGGALAYGSAIRGTDPSFPTGWKMSIGELREYLSECADAVRSAIPSGRDRIVLTGVLGTQDGGSLTHELALVRPQATPDANVRLSGSAFTKYAYPRGRGDNCWQEATTPSEYGLRPIADLIADTHPAPNLIHDDKCLLIEAGETGHDPIDADRQRYAFGQAMVLTTTLGYAGIFLWNYDDPGRSPNFSPISDEQTNHPMTENGAIAHESTSFVLHGQILGRAAVREIQRFSAWLGRLQLPRAPWP